MKKCIFLIWMLLTISYIFALTAGDIAILAVNTDATKSIAFVALNDIPSNTSISFTDNAWNATTQSFRSGEGTIAWSNTTITVKGSVILLTLGTSSNSSNIGTVTFNSNFNLSASGDQILVYEGETAPSSNDASNWLWGFSIESFTWGGNSNTSDIPTALTNYSAAMTTSTSEVDNAYFANGSTAQTTVSVSGTKAELISLFIDSNKYYKNDTGPLTIPTYTINVESEENPTVSLPSFSPTGGNYYENIVVEILCATEGATIYYTTNGSDPDNTSTLYTVPINITQTTTLKAIAYADGYDPSPIASAVYTFPEIIEVADIATLRNQSTGSNIYRLTGEAILTFQQSISSHPKWVQDATAAIYIYDTAGKITTAYNIGDGITGLLGTLSNYNSLLEFVPVADPGPASSTGNIIAPVERTLASLTSADQSKLIKVYNVTLGATGNFATDAQNITVTQGATSLTLRTLTSTDYNGQPIPQTPQNITCLVGQYNANIQISPRFLADFEDAYDIPEGSPVTIGSDVVEITGGSANIVTGDIPPVNNNAFVASSNFILDLLGAGPWHIEIQTTALWGAYYFESAWHSSVNSEGKIIFNVPNAKGVLVPIVLGEEDPTLPVELSSFTAVLTSDMYVRINWIAESETNHSGYNILRAEKKDLATAQKINARLIDDGIENGTQIDYTYTDFETYSNMVYYYWLESVSLDGISDFYGPLTITIGDPTQEPNPPTIPMVTKLLNAYPNPFNPNTNIRYSLKDAGKVRIDIYNMKGQMINSLTAEHDSPGFYQIAWDGCDANGKPVSSGIYMYKMISGNYLSAKKMILAK